MSSDARNANVIAVGPQRFDHGVSVRAGFSRLRDGPKPVRTLTLDCEDRRDGEAVLLTAEEFDQRRPGSVRYCAFGSAFASACVPLRIHWGLFPPSMTSAGIVT